MTNAQAKVENQILVLPRRKTAISLQPVRLGGGESMNKTYVGACMSVIFLFGAIVAVSAQGDEGGGTGMHTEPPPAPNCNISSMEKKALSALDFTLLKTILQYSTPPEKTIWKGRPAWKIIPKRLEPAIASSFLKADKFGSYSPENALDYNLETSWVESVKGPGYGEWIAFTSDIQGDALVVHPGYGTTAWILNNRIMEARIRLFAVGKLDGSAPKAGESVLILDELIDTSVFFNDLNEDAYVYRGRGDDYMLESPGKYLAVFEILSVFNGSKYDDTCLAEIRYEEIQFEQ